MNYNGFILLLLLLFQRTWEFPDYVEITMEDKNAKQKLLDHTTSNPNKKQENIAFKTNNPYETGSVVKLKDKINEEVEFLKKKKYFKENDELYSNLWYPSESIFWQWRNFRGKVAMEGMLKHRNRRHVKAAKKTTKKVTAATVVQQQHVPSSGPSAPGVINPAVVGATVKTAIPAVVGSATVKPAVPWAVTVKPARPLRAKPATLPHKPRMPVAAVTAAKPGDVPMGGARPPAFPAVTAKPPGNIQMPGAHIGMPGKPGMPVTNKPLGLPPVGLNRLPGAAPCLAPPKVGVPPGLPPFGAPAGGAGWAPQFPNNRPATAAITSKPAAFVVATTVAVVQTMAPEMSYTDKEDSMFDLERLIKEAGAEIPSNSTAPPNDPSNHDPKDSFDLDSLVGGFLGGLANVPGPSPTAAAAETSSNSTAPPNDPSNLHPKDSFDLDSLVGGFLGGLANGPGPRTTAAAAETSSNSTAPPNVPSNLHPKDSFDLDSLVGGFLGGLANGPGPSTPSDGAVK